MKIFSLTTGRRTMLPPGFACLLLSAATCLVARPAGAQNLSDHVNTLRGSNSSIGYSNGNTFPGVTVPFGFNFWTPVSSSNSHSWIFDYNASAIEGFAASHEPSPWIGDHGAFQLMPMVGSLQTGGSARRASYDHANEIAKAHYYSVVLDNGIRTEFTPTDHAVVFKFTFPASAEAHILFDTEDEVGAGNPVLGDVSIDQGAGTVSGHVDHRGPRLYFYATVSKAIGSVFDGANAQGAVGFSTSAGEVVTVKLATSFLSVEQASANLAQEVGDQTFDQVLAAAQGIWDQTLGKIEVEGATQDELVTFYSNLYRAFMYPNSMWENVNGAPQYFSPYSNQVEDGKIYVNNGFWDTFRAAWPLYALLVPEQAGVMLDGFVRAYEDGGWTPRWSGPGYIDIMVGSHSDSIFADAYMKGITNFDVDAAYQSALKNALVYSGNGALGRKGQGRSIFKGYIPVEDLGESAAWYLEDTINDFGISQLAKALGDDTHARYFREKAFTYVNLFSESVGFFRGRRADGSWRTSDADFFPNEWGYEFTEGCAWHYATAAQNDPQGMANLYGGRAALSAKIDSLFTASSDFLVGSYGGVIHEMVEAQDTNMGQYAHANEPIHHMLYMYNYAGTPSKTQEHVRDVLDIGNGVYGPGYDGKGYLGDEDNGQMSAWYVFSAIGFYPASPGNPEYAIGSPLFTKATLHLENGSDLVVSAPLNSATNLYIQSATLNGAPFTKNFLTHAELLQGGELELVMGDAPSAWGSAEGDVPSSVTKTSRVPLPARDRASGGTLTASFDSADDEGAAMAFDDDSGTKWLSTSPTGSLEYQFADELGHPVILYTVTSGDDAPERDPKAWTLQASSDGVTWDTLDTQADVSFDFRRQTQVFSTGTDAPYGRYRLDISENNGAPLLQLAEVELIGAAPIPAASASGSAPCSEGESPDKAIDGRMTTKWCSSAEAPELVVDLGGAAMVRHIVLRHAGAGGEDVARNSRDFTLSVSGDGTAFTVVDDVVGNTSDVTQHTFEPALTTQVKLALSAPGQDGEAVARIYELEIYGTVIPVEEPGMGGTGGSAGVGGTAGVGAGAGAGASAATGAGAGAGASAGAATGAGASSSGAKDDSGCACATGPGSGERGRLAGGLGALLLAGLGVTWRARRRHALVTAGAA